MRKQIQITSMWQPKKFNIHDLILILNYSSVEHSTKVCTTPPLDGFVALALAVAEKPAVGALANGDLHLRFLGFRELDNGSLGGFAALALAVAEIAAVGALANGDLDRFLGFRELDNRSLGGFAALALAVAEIAAVGALAPDRLG